MADFISMGVEGEEKLQRALTGIARDVSDFRPSWRAVSDEVYSIERNQFATEGSRAGARWPKRSDAYLDRLTALNRRGFTTIAEPLRLTGALYDAVGSRNAPHGIYDEQPESLTLGTDLPYANIHQKGAKNGRPPQRKIYDLTEQDASRIMGILKRGLVTKIKDRGFDFVDTGGVIPF